MPLVSVNRTELTLKSDARATSRAPDRHSRISSNAGPAAPTGPRLDIPARTPPTTTLPSSAQKMKNLVLSHSHGCRMITFGTRNHSHIGANHFGNAVGNQRCRKWPAIRSGINADVFLIQNHGQSIGKKISPWRSQSRYESQPKSMQ